MSIRYAPMTAMRQDPKGNYVTIAEYDEAINYFLETVGDLLREVESGGTTAAEAEKRLQGVVAMTR